MKFKVIVIIGMFVTALAIISSCQGETELNFKRYYVNGSTVYQAHCQNCHGANGEGLGALIPPLTDSAYLKTNLHQLPCFVKNGLTGSITVHAKPYAQAMPPAELTAIELAEVLTYVGNSFGNKLGLLDVDMVTGDLAKCR
ncbi:cbb3-type cytochrome c oxidase subunit III [Mucilaginibacter gracilis]|uniref:Cbb3-type cytochrome c oxidase subunit III n=1 Tax=Mucilaginibacter gracilis TaxID=423350 RepID=A0A495J4H5_9SPHI|nr:cytochrome c [Mucilaginibacter gracilis]RKR83244.1 cbb3-type cytochrome c oxidase subunit III [Mucilaginibacter gracilis]